MKHKDDTKTRKTIAASSTKDLKEDEETTKRKTTGLPKRTRTEIVDFMKAQNSKVELFKYWDEN